MMGIKNLKIDVSHISFSILFTTSLYTVCNAWNIEKIAKWFSVGDGIDYLGLFAFLVFGLCVFMAFFVLLSHRWTVKPLAVVFIVLSTVVTYFISKYDVAIDRTMVMNSVYTDATEVGSLLSVHMLPYVFFLTVLPTVVVLNLNITFSRAIKYIPKSLILSAFVLVIGVGLIYLNYNSVHRAGNISNKYIIDKLVPINYMRSIASAVHRTIEANNRQNKQPVVISGSITSMDNLVVVLAIGETSRQKNFTLYGYDRKNTNPVLSKINDLHVLNGNAKIGTTLLALPEILQKNDIKLPTITSQLGINTSCYVNYKLYDNCDAVGEIHVNNCGHEGKCYDEDVVPLLENNLATYESGYRFVVLHLGGGSHGPKYSDRHPPEFQQFKPQCLEADVVNHCSKEELYNSYDNTILYVDYVLGETIKKLDDSGAPYVFIYLSDHGESLLEDGRIFHGMPPGISLPPEQADIPLIVKSSLPISIIQRDEYKQNDVFDTVLDLFSIETSTLNKERVFIKIKNI